MAKGKQAAGKGKGGGGKWLEEKSDIVLIRPHLDKEVKKDDGKLKPATSVKVNSTWPQWEEITYRKVIRSDIFCVKSILE